MTTNTDKTIVIRNDITDREESIILFYSDNGIGFPNSISFENPGGFGIKLINLLVKQINGSISFESNNGAQFKIQFSPKS